MSEELAAQSCKACVGATEAMNITRQQELIGKLNDWNIIDEHHLERKYTFKNFKQALAFVNLVGEIAETEKHHPDIYFTWGKVVIQIMTHSVNGLTEADFVLAAKINQIDS